MGVREQEAEQKLTQLTRAVARLAIMEHIIESIPCYIEDDCRVAVNSLSNRRDKMYREVNRLRKEML